MISVLTCLKKTTAVFVVVGLKHHEGAGCISFHHKTVITKNVNLRFPEGSLKILKNSYNI